MNQNVNPVVAFLIIAITISIIGFKYWANDEALQVRGPEQMQHDNENNLYLTINDTLYKLSPKMNLLAEYSLDNLGVYDLVGDFGIFSNGDILIRRGRFDPSFIQNIFAYLRISDVLPTAENTTTDGLYRCNLETSECNTFGDLSKDFDSAFHMAIDPTTAQMAAEIKDLMNLANSDYNKEAFDRTAVSIFIKSVFCDSVRSQLRRLEKTPKDLTEVVTQATRILNAEAEEKRQNKSIRALVPSEQVQDHSKKPASPVNKNASNTNKQNQYPQNKSFAKGYKNGYNKNQTIEGQTMIFM